MTAETLSQLKQQALTGLRHYWGYNSFRPLQSEVVVALLQFQDALVMLPTGAGKSVCFQLPALLQGGLTLVVSPLVALIENQVQALLDRKIPAGLYHSEQSRDQRQRTLFLLERGQLRLLYLSPESLLSTVLWERLRLAATQVNRLVIDEAHCITQWGSSFRPVYRRLGAARKALAQGRSTTEPALAIAAFTATADAATQQDIQHALDLHQPRVFRSSPYRRNLSIGVTRIYTVAARRDRLLSFVRAQGNSSGLVYTRSRRDSEALALWLTQQGFTTAAYHAGLSAVERRQIEQQWLSGELRFTICTSAFGMGVDKSDVGWVCHFHPPLTLAEYLQEIGRAGRNGQPAQALLLASEATGLLDPTDKQRTAGFMRQMQQQQQLAQRLVRSLPPEGRLQDVLQQEPQAELALALLHRQGSLVWLDPFCYRLTTQYQLSAPVTAVSALEEYLATRGCRWQFLLAAFGFGREAQGLRCGHCDRCLKKS